MKKKLVVLGILSVFILSLLAGCGTTQQGTDNPEPSAQESGAQGSGTQENVPQELTKFDVGYLATPGHVLYFVAKEQGYFEEEGLDVELFQFTNSGEGLGAIQAGKLDAGSFGTAAPLAFISKGSDFTIFGGQQTEGHALIASPEKAEELKELANYKGKTIATVRLSTGDVVFRGALTEAGIDWKTELTISELDSPAAVLEAVKKGSVDAGIVWTPYVEMAKAQGLEAVTYSGDLLKEHPCCRQVALSSAIKESPEKYEKFMTALIKAYDFYKTNQDETVDIISKYVQIDTTLIQQETYGGHIFSIPDPNKEGVIEFWNFMNKIGYIESDVSIENHINIDIYRNALDGLVSKFPENETYKDLKAHFDQ
jgi:NitT/TauT family transport system substrate-binding protein